MDCCLWSRQSDSLSRGSRASLKNLVTGCCSGRGTVSGRLGEKNADRQTCCDPYPGQDYTVVEAHRRDRFWDMRTVVQIHALQAARTRR